MYYFHPNCSFYTENLNLVLRFCHVMSFYALQISFEEIYYAFAERPDKLFGTRLKQNTFEFAGKSLDYLASGKFLFFRCSEFLIASTVRVKKVKEWIQFLYRDVMDHLFVATSQSTIDRWEHLLRFHTSEIALI